MTIARDKEYCYVGLPTPNPELHEPWVIEQEGREVLTVIYHCSPYKIRRLMVVVLFSLLRFSVAHNITDCSMESFLSVNLVHQIFPPTWKDQVEIIHFHWRHILWNKYGWLHFYTFNFVSLFWPISLSVSRCVCQKSAENNCPSSHEHLF